MNREEIKERVSIFDLCRDYGIKVGRNRQVVCPFHNDNHPSGYISRNGKYFKCFACQKNLDVFGFVMEMEDISFKDAYKKLGGSKSSSKEISSYIKKRKRRRAREILAILDYALYENFIKQKAESLKRLEKEIFDIRARNYLKFKRDFPGMRKKPVWFDYLREDGTVKKQIPSYLATYIYEQYSVEKRYEIADELFNFYRSKGYQVASVTPHKIMDFFKEYMKLVEEGYADKEDINKMLFNIHCRRCFYFNKENKCSAHNVNCNFYSQCS